MTKYLKYTVVTVFVSSILTLQLKYKYKIMKKESRFDKLIWISESQTETTYTYTR